MHYFSNLLWWRTLYVNITSMTNINCFEYSIKTPDDGR